MSSISPISSSSASASQLAYQEYLARLQAARENQKAAEANETAQNSPSPATDTDHDGDSH